MAQLPILIAPDPRLKVMAKPVTKVDGEIRKLMDDMLETMYEAPGIGLAATQVNIHKRLLVLDISEKRNEPCCLINPKILSREGQIGYEEGCLSVPGFSEEIQRAERISVEALDEKGSPRKFEAEGLFAVCIQHEMDHLEGKLFVDYLSELKRQRLKKKIIKQSKQTKADAARETGRLTAPVI